MYLRFKITKVYLWIVITLFVFSTTPLSAQTAREIMNMAEQGVVRIIAENGNNRTFASGVIVKITQERIGYIVTNHHLIEHLTGSDATLIIEKGGIQYRAKIYRYQRPVSRPPVYDNAVLPDLDLALLVTDEKLPIEGVKPLLLVRKKEVEDAVEKGEQVKVFGCPDGTLNQLNGHVNFKQGADLYFTLPLNIPVPGGMSGGPVMNKNGHVLGITKEYGTGYNRAVTADIILYFLESWGIVEPRLRLFYKKVGFNFSLGYSRLSMNPNLPRDFQIHANHPDDEFPTGSPGNTDLDRIQLDSLELEIGPSFRLGKSNMALFAFYVAKIPFSKVGRDERQQENDPRPPSEGSYIYTKLADTGIGHIFRSGLGAAFQISEYSDSWLEIQCLFEVGKWDMDFEKGWTRFGRDEAEWRSEASGFFFSPKGKMSLSTDRWSIFFSLGSTQINFDHPHPHLETHACRVYEVALGGRFIF